MTTGTKTGRMASLAVLCALAACSTTNLEDLAPGPSVTAVSSAPAAGEAASLSRPGDYPNLNVVPRPATAQFTDEEREAEAAALRARREQLAGGGVVADRRDDLRRLARTHGDKAIEAIEAE